MNTQQPPTTSSSDGADPIGQRVNWATVGPSLIFYGGLLSILSLSVGAAIRFQDTPYFIKWVVMSVVLSLGAIWCGGLIWWRRRGNQHTVFEICLAMFLAMAVKDSVVYWQNGEDAFSPSLMWFCVLGYISMLVYSKFAKKLAEPPAPSEELAMQLEDDSQALLKHRETRQTIKPPNP